MKNKLKKISIFSLKLLVVILAFSALTLNGVNATQRLFADCEQIDQSQAEIAEMLLQSGPPAPEDMPGNMEKSGKANTDQQATLVNAPLIKFDNSQSRLKDNYQKELIVYNKIKSNRSIALKSNLNYISSHLGHRFTLVGLKPSGTM